MTRPTVTFDDDRGELSINGVRYAYGLFDTMAFGPLGKFIRIEARHGGTITVRGFSPDLERAFITLANLP